MRSEISLHLSIGNATRAATAPHAVSRAWKSVTILPGFWVRPFPLPSFGGLCPALLDRHHLTPDVQKTNALGEEALPGRIQLKVGLGQGEGPDAFRRLDAVLPLTPVTLPMRAGVGRGGRMRVPGKSPWNGRQGAGAGKAPAGSPQ